MKPDLRATIRSEIASIAAHDPLEQRDLDDIDTWITSGAKLCRRISPATPPKHLVSYVLPIDGAHILLVDHKKARRWLPPGGHVEPGEHPLDTAKREAEEELGISPDFLTDRPLFVTITETVGATPGHTDVSLWYLLRGDRHMTLDFDRSEFNKVHWFPISERPIERTDPQLGRFLGKIAAMGLIGV
jgi:8-oxo-dGTP pyrophosphatase MutT (NUDIX family)